MTCRQYNPNDIPAILDLYREAFPPEERRPYSNEGDFINFIDSQNGTFNILVCEDNGIITGFLTYWKFKRYVYVEHFAVTSVKRGSGAGTLMLETLAEKIQPNILLEVELPETVEAAKRIKFYEKRGFSVNHAFDYIQPPYAPGLPEVPMLIMTHGDLNPDSPEDIAELLVNVYGAAI